MTQEFYNEWGAFCVDKFGDDRTHQSLLKAETELPELHAAISEELSRDEVAEEYADVLMCVLNSAHCYGLTFDELQEALMQKLEKNKGRTWVEQPDGTYQHSKEAEHVDSDCVMIWDEVIIGRFYMLKSGYVVKAVRKDGAVLSDKSIQAEFHLSGDVYDYETIYAHEIAYEARQQEW